MSFSLTVKEELSQLPIGTQKENQAELYSILGFSRCFLYKNRLFASEIRALVERISFYLYKTSKNKIKNDNVFYYLPKDRSLSENRIMSNLQELIIDSRNDLLTPQLLRGVFLACGNITNPKSSYHLEFSIKNQLCYEFLTLLLKKIEIVTLTPKIIKRKSSIYMYIKDHSQITDFLTYIGATNSSMQFIQVKMVKEVRNYVNRTTNFETANLTKTTFAASDQIIKIKKLINSKLWNDIPEYLKETAILRLKNPYLSLEELSKLFSEPITKSGVNYRLRKILEYIS